MYFPAFSILLLVKITYISVSTTGVSNTWPRGNMPLAS